MKNIKTISNFKRLAEKYNFSIREGMNIVRGKYIILEAIGTDGEMTDWIRFLPEKDMVSVLGNTDQCNIWFYYTRKDFTPEKIAEFIKDLNCVFELKGESIFTISELIDPEDWQIITGVSDAYTDNRYTSRA